MYKRFFIIGIFVLFVLFGCTKDINIQINDQKAEAKVQTLKYSTDNQTNFLQLLTYQKIEHGSGLGTVRVYKLIDKDNGNLIYMGVCGEGVGLSVVPKEQQ